MFVLEHIESEEQYLKFIECEKKDKDFFKESQIQAMVIEWLKKNDIDFHPSFSGLKASHGQRRFMKSQGMESGHPDLTIEKKAGKHEVLFLELKTVKNDLRKSQKAWIKKKIREGFAVSVSYGYYDSIYKIVKYLEGSPIYFECQKKEKVEA